MPRRPTIAQEAHFLTWLHRTSLDPAQEAHYCPGGPLFNMAKDQQRIINRQNKPKTLVEDLDLNIPEELILTMVAIVIGIQTQALVSLVLYR